MHYPDTGHSRLLATIRNADNTGTLQNVNDDVLLTFAKGMAAEALLGGYASAKTIAVQAYGIPSDVCDTVTAAALPGYYPFTSAAFRARQ